MKTSYTSERNVQMLIYLMKQHGIKKVVASPGANNITFVASIQGDSYFEIYSSVDERSAAYIACGLAAKSGEPVALTCTGATASRNYLSGLTEAFYSKLPILAVTATRHFGTVGQHIPQAIDRRVQLNDTAKLSVQIPAVRDAEDEWAYGVMLNDALLELRHRGGGPVHINMVMNRDANFSVTEIKPVKVIRRIRTNDTMPEIKANSVAVFVGSHQKWDEELTRAADDFCEAYNGVVLCDRTSNYPGKYRIFPHLVCGQTLYKSPCATPELLISIGEISGAYLKVSPKQVWRVSPDGEVRDTFRRLTSVFEMGETEFFRSCTAQADNKKNATKYFDAWKSECGRLEKKIPELPLSNIWIAQQTLGKLPADGVLHLGILNSLRAWNFFAGAASFLGYCNTGGFGIDGCTSALIGASFADPRKLFFGIMGDLSFFYDMNSIGNRHVGKNIRLMVINNGKGTEFRNYTHAAARFGEDADEYIAAARHYGDKSDHLLKHYAKDLGFEYHSASSKEEYMEHVEWFTSPDPSERPFLFEVFTSSEDESDALKMMKHIEVTKALELNQQAKNIVKDALGEKGASFIKKIIQK